MRETPDPLPRCSARLNLSNPVECSPRMYLARPGLAGKTGGSGGGSGLRAVAAWQPDGASLIPQLQAARSTSVSAPQPRG